MRKNVLMAGVLSAAMVLSGMAVAQSSGSSSSSSQSESQQASTSSKSGSNSLNAKDRAFMKEAAEGGLMEVELGQMVQQKAESQDVKQFAQRMVDDHTKLNDQLKSVAQQVNFTVPTSMSAKGKAAKQRLEKLSGEQLDRAYMQLMVQDHTQDVAKFKQESKTAKNDAVKQLAEQATPTLESHLQEAKKVAAQERKEGKSGQQSKSQASQ